MIVGREEGGSRWDFSLRAHFFKKLNNLIELSLERQSAFILNLLKVLEQGDHVDENLAQIVTQLFKELFDALDVLDYVLSIVDQRRDLIDGLGKLPQSTHFSFGFSKKLIAMEHLHAVFIRLHLLLLVRNIFDVDKAWIFPCVAL